MRLTLPPPSALLGKVQSTSDPVAKRAAAALTQALSGMEYSEPFAGAHARILRALSAHSEASAAQELGALFDYWASRSPGNPRGDMRYRWELSHRRGVRMPDYAPDETAWRPWRAAEAPVLAKDPFEFEQRLATPIILTENAELLAEAAEAGDEVAQELLDEVSPVLRRDFAFFVQGLDPWQDTFALWCLTRRLRVLSMLHPMAVAIATGYAAGAGRDHGPVLGIRFPFHKAPLVSASAQLASALLALGSDMDLVASLVDFVRDAELPDGGWGDASETADVLTSLVAADLMARIDPTYDVSRVQRYLEGAQGKDGLWRALGPEAPWLSAEIVAMLLSTRQPFPLRFRWPYLPPANRDQKTRLPFYAYFSDLCGLFSALPGLAQSEVELGFVDLVGFRAFNNAFGQERGDQVLRAFADELLTLDHVRPIRDGGDEFILVAAPERRGLRVDLDGFRRDWPARFRQRFGEDVPPVAPRILVCRSRADRLIAAREQLGIRITALKSEQHGEDGILRDLGVLE
ncbi:MAG TPA: diguanylate cyclase [Polyangiaceae bacterium]|nr:diguanylate cyclase [Polyangiaceae bacterium]